MNMPNTFVASRPLGPTDKQTTNAVATPGAVVADVGILNRRRHGHGHEPLVVPAPLAEKALDRVYPGLVVCMTPATKEAGRRVRATNSTRTGQHAGTLTHVVGHFPWLGLGAGQLDIIDPACADVKPLGVIETSADAQSSYMALQTLTTQGQITRGNPFDQNAAVQDAVIANNPDADPTHRIGGMPDNYRYLSLAFVQKSSINRDLLSALDAGMRVPEQGGERLRIGAKYAAYAINNSPVKRAAARVFFATALGDPRARRLAGDGEADAAAGLIECTRMQDSMRRLTIGSVNRTSGNDHNFMLSP